MNNALKNAATCMIACTAILVLFVSCVLDTRGMMKGGWSEEGTEGEAGDMVSETGREVEDGDTAGDMFSEPGREEDEGDEIQEAEDVEVEDVTEDFEQEVTCTPGLPCEGGGLCCSVGGFLGCHESALGCDCAEDISICGGLLCCDVEGRSQCVPDSGPCRCSRHEQCGPGKVCCDIQGDIDFFRECSATACGCLCSDMPGGNCDYLGEGLPCVVIDYICFDPVICWF